MIKNPSRSNDNRIFRGGVGVAGVAVPLLMVACLWWQSGINSAAYAVNIKLPSPPPLPNQPQPPQFHPAAIIPAGPVAPAFPGQVGKDFADCMKLANDALKRGSMESAADNFTEAIRLKPLEPAPHLGLGKAYQATEHEDQALEEFFGALTLKPDYWAARFGIGQILMKRESWDEAAQQFMQIMHSCPTDLGTRGNLAICYEEKGQIDSAIEQFKYITQVAPGNVEAHYNLACAYDLKGDFDNAAIEYRITIKLDPKHPMAYIALGNCLINKRDYKNAVIIDEAAVRLYPSNYFAYIGLGRAYECMTKWDDAKKNYRKAIQINPKAPECQKLIHNMLKERAQELGISGLPGL